MKILFICASNICRSPFCEYYFKRMVENDSELAEKVESVRSSAVFNKSKRIHPNAVQALKREGFEEDYILSHKPTFKWTDKHLFEDADYIVGMSKKNKWFLPIKFRKKFTTLSEFATGEYKVVVDPFLMKTVEEYNAVMDQIKDYLEKLAKKIKKEC